MRIGFFGGSFDPPHLGHLAVGRAASDAFSLERVLFAPTGRQPLKPDGPSASFEDRLSMVSLLCELQSGDARSRFEPSALEAPRIDGAPNYTVDTLQKLRAECSVEDCLFVLIGADAFLGLPGWKSPETLLYLADWIVVSRPGVALPKLDELNLTANQVKRVHLLEDVHEMASATEIRNLLKAHSDCAGLLPKAILNFIRTRHLYGT
jgi:nicotinate-nucleotide adenylyltransferase